MKLNLTANRESEKRVKEYLENNVSEVLAEKINNGVLIEKDGKTLINKKTLSGFMKYATDEARKTVQNGANCACIEDSVVYGWAVHYFEEDSIEEKLYTESGEEYTKAPKKKEEKKVEVKKEEKPMDLLDMAQEKETGEDDTDDGNDGSQVPAPVVQPKKKLPKGVSENQISFFDFGD